MAPSWRGQQKLRKWLYISLWAKIDKTKCTLFSQTLKVWENTASFFFFNFGSWNGLWSFFKFEDCTFLTWFIVFKFKDCTFSIWFTFSKFKGCTFLTGFTFSKFEDCTFFTWFTENACHSHLTKAQVVIGGNLWFLLSAPPSVGWSSESLKMVPFIFFIFHNYWLRVHNILLMLYLCRCFTVGRMASAKKYQDKFSKS